MLKRIAGPLVLRGDLDARGLRFGVVVSRFNDFITGRLLQGALDCLASHGARRRDVTVVHVPGALEIPVAALRPPPPRRCDAAIAIGCVIRGETAHYDQVCAEVARGTAAVALATGRPVTFG